MNTKTPELLIKSLGQKLERYRLMQNISQQQLSKQAGIGERTLRRLEAGQGGTLETFIRVLTALKLDQNLDVLIPDHTIRPIERASQSKTERQRARPKRIAEHPNIPTSTNLDDGNNKKVKGSGKASSTWRWGDEKS